jgi:WD and tetratricopeptide repeat-containing protein 1
MLGLVAVGFSECCNCCPGYNELLLLPLLLQVMLWKYPDAKQMPIQVETEHQGNIFGVRFLPDSGDRRIVTGAMDFLVQLHTLETKPSRPTPRTANTSPLPNPGINNVLRDFEGAPSVAADSSTKSFACHRGRVKVCVYPPSLSQDIHT